MLPTCSRRAPDVLLYTCSVPLLLGSFSDLSFLLVKCSINCQVMSHLMNQVLKMSTIAEDFASWHLWFTGLMHRKASAQHPAHLPGTALLVFQRLNAEPQGTDPCIDGNNGHEAHMIQSGAEALAWLSNSVDKEILQMISSLPNPSSTRTRRSMPSSSESLTFTPGQLPAGSTVFRL